MSTTIHLTIQIIVGTEVTDAHLKECSALFSRNYGVWAPNVPAPMKPGARVKMQPARMRAECLSDPINTVLIMKHIDNNLVAHAFATKWAFGTEVVGWITQLVVDVNQRKKYIATRLLRELRDSTWFNGITMMSLVSSHPAACTALCKMFHVKVDLVDLTYIKKNAQLALQSSTVRYVREAQLRGKLFEEDPVAGAVSLVYTGFYVDHAEPQGVLDTYVEANRWSLGELKDGHEFIVLVCAAPSPVPSQAPDVFGS